MAAVFPADSFRLNCRLAGLAYLGLAICGALGFMMIRAKLFAAGDAGQTSSNLIEHATLARLGIALEFGTSTFQALAAVLFYRLFREIDGFAATALALFGLVNAVAVLVSAALMNVSLEIAQSAEKFEPALSYGLFSLSSSLWTAGMIYFGLWLIPMGWLCWRARLGHSLLGWLLVVGGAGYVLNAFIVVLAPESGKWVGLLPITATIGEFWMIGLLLWRGFAYREIRAT